MGVALRPRRAEDLPALLAVLQRTHEQDSYPVRPEAVSGGWLARGEELWSAVAVDGDRVVGHVALHPAGADDAGRQWAAATGAPVDRLAVVSRLFTDRTVRGSGAALLDAAVHAAQADGRTPVLLVDPDGAARDWYRRRAWRAIGTSRQQWGPRTVDAVLLLPP